MTESNTLNSRPILDVSTLPELTFGSGDPMWWGALGIMVIEGATFAVIVATYFYYAWSWTSGPDLRSKLRGLCCLRSISSS